MSINRPYFEEVDGEFALFRPNFTGREEKDKEKFTEHTFVSGPPALIGRFSSERELQIESLRLFNQQAGRKLN